MRIKRPAIILDGIQLKSLEKIKRVAYLLNELEIETGIYETTITFRDIFLCPDIDLTHLSNIAMEGVVKRCLKKLREKDKTKFSVDA